MADRKERPNRNHDEETIGSGDERIRGVASDEEEFEDTEDMDEEDTDDEEEEGAL